MTCTRSVLRTTAQAAPSRSCLRRASKDIPLQFAWRRLVPPAPAPGERSCPFRRNSSIRANGALSEHCPARHRRDEAGDRRSTGCPASGDARLRYGRICHRPASARMPEFPCLPDIARRQAASRADSYCFDKILAVCARPARSYLPVSKAFRPSVVRSCFFVRGKPNADDAPGFKVPL
jgi:hypothetical protein